jgi:DNA helicase-2/ATP-dependent DNA helicase PcrA
VLVDEYQDTNPIQCEIVDLLAAENQNLTVVGDDAQSIYGFRGADPKNMLGFHERWPEARTYKLETNYRSTPEILALANRSIEYNRNQLPKALAATRESGPKPALVSVRDADVQAAFVAQRVSELADEGNRLSSMAVLYRAHSHSLELQVELARRGIPYIVRSGVRFFEQAHIKDVLAHLRILENPLDELSWMRVLKLQPGIGRTTALRIWQILQEASNPLEAATSAFPAASLTPRTRSGFNQLKSLLSELNRSTTRSTSTAIQTILEQGYRDLLPKLYANPETRKDDIEQLARYSDHFEDVRTFLSELNLLAGFSTEEVLRAKKADDHLILSTIHQAKGLEFSAVFVLGLCEGTFPHPWALTESGGDDQEERRLFYVALTRTKDELYLISPLAADRAGGRRVLLRPSRFIDEVNDPDLAEHWNVEEGGEDPQVPF